MQDMQSAHHKNMKLWREGSTVPPLHKPLASLSFKGPSLEALAMSVASLPEQVACLGSQADSQFLEALRYYDLPPDVFSAVHKCSRLLRKLVRQETGDSPRVDAIFGPYKPFDEDWHHDADGKPDIGHIVYTLTLVGPPTDFSTKAYGKNDFDGRALKKEMYPTAQEIFTYGAGVIAAHDGMTTVHRAPDPVHQGVPRIFLSSLARYAMLNPA